MCLGSSAGARTVAAGAARGHVRFAETIPATSPHPKASAEAADRTAPHTPEPGSEAYAPPPPVPGAPAPAAVRGRYRPAARCDAIGRGAIAIGLCSCDGACRATLADIDGQ